jgi:hypothetical protein
LASSEEILVELDTCFTRSAYTHFIDLGHGYSYLIDSRLNLFRNGNQWAIAAERLGYNPRQGAIILEIFYYGNCLVDLEIYNNQYSNYYQILPIDETELNLLFDNEYISQDSIQLNVRGATIPVIHDRDYYLSNSIILKDYVPGRIGIEEFARATIILNNKVFRATDIELHKSIPKSLQKIMILDEWYHEDYSGQWEEWGDSVKYEFDMIKTFDLYREDYTQKGYNLEKFLNYFRFKNSEFLRSQNANTPGSIETWQLISQVLETGDPSIYKPKLASNSHWTNWPDSGGL